MSTLSESDIDALTKPLTQRAAQKRTLERMLGVKLKARPDGLPIVTQSMVDGMYQQQQTVASNDAGIKWSKRA